MNIKNLAFNTTNDMAASLGLFAARLTIGLTFAYYIVTNFNSHSSLAPYSALTYPVYAIAICSILILLGIFSRPAALLVVLILFAYNRLLFHDDVIHPWEELMVLYTTFFTFILITGSGCYSLETLLFKRAARV